jgi:hypothetical protein
MLLCDTLHLVGFRIFDRKRIEDDKKKENKHRLLGFDSVKRGIGRFDDSDGRSQLQIEKNNNSQVSPAKTKNT